MQARQKPHPLSGWIPRPRYCSRGRPACNKHAIAEVRLTSRACVRFAMERACHRGARGGSYSRPYRFTLRLDRDDWLGIADPATCNTSLFG